MDNIKVQGIIYHILEITDTMMKDINMKSTETEIVKKEREEIKVAIDRGQDQDQEQDPGQGQNRILENEDIKGIVVIITNPHHVEAIDKHHLNSIHHLQKDIDPKRTDIEQDHHQILVPCHHHHLRHHHHHIQP